MEPISALFAGGAAMGASGTGLAAAELATGAFAAPAAIGTATAATAGGVMSYLPVASLAMTGFGMANAARAQAKSGNAALTSAEYNAEVNRINADMMDRQAEQVEAATDYKTGQLKRQQMRFAALQSARLAKSGVSMASGSPLAELNETAYLSAMDRYMNDYAGEVEATSLRNRGILLRSNADFNLYQGAVTQNNAYDTATGTLLAGLGKMGSNYYTMKKGRYADWSDWA